MEGGNGRHLPGIPVLCESVQCRVAILKLAERPFIYDVCVPSVVEQGGRDPRLWCSQQREIFWALGSTHLQHEPTSQVDTPYCMANTR